MSPCCGGGRGAQAVLNAKRAIGQLPPQAVPEGLSSDADIIRIEYYGVRTGGVTYTGKSGTRYIFGNNTTNRYNDVRREDVGLFLSMEGFREIKRRLPGQPQAAPAEIAKAPVSEVKPEPTPAPMPEVKPEAKPEIVQEAAPKAKRTRKAKV